MCAEGRNSVCNAREVEGLLESGSDRWKRWIALSEQIRVNIQSLSVNNRAK